MVNPFEKRATEYLRDEAAFLSVVTPEPLHTFFEKQAKAGKLYDRLTMVIGTPGSGKTTIASLLQYKTVFTLLNNLNQSDYKPLINALRKCGIVEPVKNELNIKVMGCRIPMESEYRDFWELPYRIDIKMGLLKSFLQSRAVLSWIRGLKNTTQENLSAIKVQFREGAGVAENSLGGSDCESLFQRAREVERAIYEIGTALVPPLEDQLDKIATASYHPFDAIEYFIAEGQGSVRKLKPLVMLDDVHILHPDQLSSLVTWLVRREIKIGRWMLMRLDAQTSENVLVREINANTGMDISSKINKSREITDIWLQGNQDRLAQRTIFRKMAKSMADKYLRLMPVFSRHGLTRFSDLLSTSANSLSESKLVDLREKVKKLSERINISKKLKEKFKKDIDNYFTGSETTDNGEDIRLVMEQIMLHRYVNRVPQSSLFENTDEQIDLAPSKPINVTAGLAEGARIFLLHEYSRPYYYGINAVCDGSSENAEQFLQLASELVNAAEAKIIQSKLSTLPSKYQHTLLVSRAERILKEWSFPKYIEVTKLCKYIAKQCLKKSLEPNASLDEGANAFGILQCEFEKIPKSYPDLAKILHFGVAYNAISIKANYSAKNKIWSLVELSGPVIISHGLTLSRGGFLEKKVTDLIKAIEEP